MSAADPSPALFGVWLVVEYMSVFCVCVWERGGCIFHRKQETRSHNRMPQVFTLYLMRGWLHGGNPFTKLWCLSRRRREPRKEWVERRVHTWGIGKWSSTLNIDIFVCFAPNCTALMLFHIHAICPTFWNATNQTLFDALCRAAIWSLPWQICAPSFPRCTVGASQVNLWHDSGFVIMGLICLPCCKNTELSCTRSALLI